MKKFLFAIYLATLSTFNVSAETASDPRIRTEVYSDSKVYHIDAAIGRATLVQLEQDESLTVSASSVLGIGDSEAWNLGVRGNNLVFKPTKLLPRTNLLLVTNKRSYAIDLKMADKKTDATYILRFSYPDTEATKLAEFNAAEAKRIASEAAKNAIRIEINTDYSWRGINKLLSPSAAYDDGRFTSLIYDHASELPVFYKVLIDGTEALLNYHIDPEDRSRIVIHEVIRTVRARINSEVIEIYNDSYKLPKLNKLGATDPGASRITKD